MIYVSLIDYYRFVLSERAAASLDDAVVRLDRLEIGGAELIDTLHFELKERPCCRKFVEILSDIATSRA
jgi:hypothetical protein